MDAHPRSGRTEQVPHVVLAGGATGGHLFPGMALAEALRQIWPGIRLTLAGGGQSIDHYVANRYDVPLASLPAPRFEPRPLRRVLRYPLDMAIAVRRAGRFLRREQARLVIGLGGYAAAPMCLAAWRTRTPLVLLEQNVVPGRVTRWASRWASHVFTTYEETAAWLPRSARVMLAGTPVRAAFLQSTACRGPTETPIRPAPPRVIVLGGSSGASPLNAVLPRVFGDLFHETPARAREWKIFHQTGQNDLAAVRDAYAQRSINANVEPFFDEMSGLLADCDLAVCRAGGTTLAELAASGVPAVLIPYPHTKDDHQRRNAAWYAARAAATVVDQQEHPFQERLTLAMRRLLQYPDQRAAMSEAMRRAAKPRAAESIVASIRPLLAEALPSQAPHTEEAPSSPTTTPKKR